MASMYRNMFFLLYEAIGLMNNASLNVQTDLVNTYKDFSQYSRIHATHCIQNVE